MKTITLFFALLFGILAERLSAQQPADCATALRALVAAGQSTDPTRYASPGATTQGEMTGALVYLAPSLEKELLSNRVECRTPGTDGIACWTCGRNPNGDTRCAQAACAAAAARAEIHFVETAGGGSAQEADLAGGATIVIVWASDQATRQLVRSRKEGPGRMTIDVERGSELSKLFRSALAARRRIPTVRVEFSGLAMANAAGKSVATLSEVTVMKIMDKTSPAASDRPMEVVAFNYNKATWH